MIKLLKNFVGIDISKLFFDVALIKADRPGEVMHRQFKQSVQGFIQLQQWLQQQGVLFNEETLVCMEYTGIYNSALVNYLCNQKALIWVEMAVKIKKAAGFERGCNDKTDSMKIALYAFRYQDKKMLWSPADAHLDRIRHLIAQRDRIVDCIGKLTIPVNELKAIGCMDQARQMEKLQKKVLADLEKTKKSIEGAIMKIVGQDQELCNKVKKVTSIKGIGEVTAVAFLVYTKGFRCFNTAKQLACYCGVAPFTKKQSGISIKSKPHVSAFGNKKLKWLLHMCALSAVKHDKEIRAYWERKKREGKNAMSVINAVRNKLILRMFAVIRDDRHYVENYTKACA